MPFEYLKRDGESSTVNESHFLAALIRVIKPKTCVETGTHNGCTAKAIGDALRKNRSGHLWTYDIISCGAKNSRYVSYKIADSSKVNLPLDIDFVFVDGCHETKFIVKEFKHLKKNLSKGALVIFHDYVPWDPGYVAAAIKKLKLKGVYIPTHYGMFIYRYE
jgi:predicted O-methyltransferase YrrM